MEGIDPLSIPYRFSPVPAEYACDAGKTVPDALARINALPSVKDDEDRYDSVEDARHVRHEELRTIFSVEDLFKLFHGQFISSSAWEWIEKEHFLLWKIQNTTWHYGRETKDYNTFVRRLEGLRALRAPEGFDVRITYSTAFNYQGRAEHCARYLFLDAAFAALLYYKGKHVLTIGFSPGRSGIYLTQVQLREKKGNRWLFRLHRPLLDVAADMLRQAFKEDVWLVTGESALWGIIRAYVGQPCPIRDDEEGKARIVSFYNAPLLGYTRTGEPETIHGGRKVVRLESHVVVPASPVVLEQKARVLPGVNLPVAAGTEQDTAI